MTTSTFRIQIIACILFTIMGCGKSDDFSIVGKWYYQSIDTKVQVSNTCTLKDTTKTYVKGSAEAIEWEFTNNGKMIISFNTPTGKVSNTLDYTYSNSILTMTLNGSPAGTATLTKQGSDGFSIIQPARIYCPDKLSFSEYPNYKKY